MWATEGEIASLTQWMSESEQTLGHNEGQGRLACGLLTQWLQRLDGITYPMDV